MKKISKYDQKRIGEKLKFGEKYWDNYLIDKDISNYIRQSGQFFMANKINEK